MKKGPFCLPFDVDHEPVNDVGVSREAKERRINFTGEWKNFGKF